MRESRGGLRRVSSIVAWSTIILFGGFILGAAPKDDATTKSVELSNFDSIEVKQKTDVWCWAACAQMAHEYARHHITQEQIVQSITNRAADSDEAKRTAQQQEVLGALNPDLYKALQHRDELSAAWFSHLLLTGGKIDIKLGLPKLNGPQQPDLSFNATKIVQAILQRQPVIVALKPRGPGDTGHVVIIHALLYHAEAQRNATGKSIRIAIIERVTYTDPATGNDVHMDGSDLEKRVDFEATRASAAEYLKWLDKVNPLPKIAVKPNR